LCPRALEIAIIDRIAKGKTPKAIIAVDLYGVPYKIEEVRTIAAYSIPILEDSAEALGSHQGKCEHLEILVLFLLTGVKLLQLRGGGS
jgi:dTDP-4-amino-4,6-dideoxygalactose transaminase